MSAQSLWKNVDVEDPPEPELSPAAEKILELVDTYAELHAKQAADFAAGRELDGRRAWKMSQWARQSLVEYLEKQA